MSSDPNCATRGDTGIFGLSDTPEQSLVVLVPVPYDATTSYRPGTVNGPRAIMTASQQIDLYDVETGDPSKAGIAMVPELAGVRHWNADARPAAERVIALGGDVGEDRQAQADLQLVNDLCARVNERLRLTVDEWMSAGKVVGTVGGDHGIVYGAIAAHADRYPGLGILHVDAHADLRFAYEGFHWSHASIMENVCRTLPGVQRLVQVGLRDLCEEERNRIDGSNGRIRAFFDAELVRERFQGAIWSRQVERIVECLPRDVYVSFDIDGLDPVLCPNTGTPVPGGLSFEEASYLIGAVARSGRRIVGFDLVEVAPGPGGDEWDGNVGARLLYKLIGWTLISRAAGHVE